MGRLEVKRVRPARTTPTSPPLLLVIIAALCALTAAIPLVYLVVRVADAGAAALIETLLRERVLRLTANSVLLAVAVTASSTVLGTASAWILVRLRVPFPRIALLAAALPLAVPSYLASYGLLVLAPTVHGFWPSWLVMTAVCTPYVALPVAAALRGAPADLEAVARTLGRNSAQAFWAATWPRVRPAALAGALLVSLYTLSDFGAVSMLRYQTLTWGIHSAYGASFDRNQAAVLALLLVVLALIVVAGERRIRGRVDTSTLRAVARVTPRRWSLAPLGVVVFASP
ncbi:MAG: ABC transporter permease subunit, partial [Microbacterium sp.]